MPELTADVTVRIIGDPGEEENLALLTARLRSELRDLDVCDVEPPASPETPDDAKGLGAALGWLVIRMGRDPLRTVLAAIVDWALRNDHLVEVTIDGDTLKLGRATREQQEQVVNTWLTRHASPNPAA
jgi:hypothetical protein